MKTCGSSMKSWKEVGEGVDDGVAMVVEFEACTKKNVYLTIATGSDGYVRVSDSPAALSSRPQLHYSSMF